MARQAGFTLVELIITIVLVGIIAGTAGILVTEGTRAYLEEDQRADATSQARLALERMAREIRSIPRATAITAPGGNPTTSLSFTNPTGLPITYTRNGGAIERTEGTGPPAPVPAILADGVTNLQFRHYDRAGVETVTPANIWQIRIDLTVTKGAEVQVFRVRVFPRNFA